MRNQRTVQGTAEVRGVGLHTGAATTLRVGPAPADAGVVFVRTDLPGRPRIPVDGLHVVDRGRRTALAEGTAEVHTVEHLLSACHGLGVDDLVVEIDGVEVPGMDGSALPFVELLRRAGIVEIPDAPRRELSLADAVGVVEPGSEAPLAALPRESGLQVSYTLDYGPAAPFPPQHVTVAVSEDSYVREIAPARTFVMESEAKALRERGLGKGATHENTLVVGPEGPIRNALRFPDEYCRHKLLDMMGDLFLLGADLRAHVSGLRSGHAGNALLVRRLAALVRAEVDLEERRSRRLDIGEIQRILPHRYPFLLVDRVLDVDGFHRAVGVKNVTINEQFFQGHWPGTPVMPGVLIIEAMAQLSGVLLLRKLDNTGRIAVLLSIDRVKLRRTVVPGDQLILEVETLKLKARTGRVRGRATVEGELAAEARINFMLVDA
ncbi:MAG: UDP-3-O-acyl-N-acetylglucosamine deacetylase [Planctomycetes bacterium]|nr:UDP-3-O-acyl-N-acetylglucosamine deacetylase [Planctomycetota bacterium]